MSFILKLLLHLLNNYDICLYKWHLKMITKTIYKLKLFSFYSLKYSDKFTCNIIFQIRKWINHSKEIAECKITIISMPCLNKSFSGRKSKHHLLSYTEDLATLLVFFRTSCMCTEAMIIMNLTSWLIFVFFHSITINGKRFNRREIYQAEDTRRQLLFIKKKCICSEESMNSWQIQIYYIFSSLELIVGLSPKLQEIYHL
jgi:hypothetical protein